MENKTATDSRKRKALLLLPVILIPLLTLAFWSLGGGKGEAREKSSHSGLNLQLPNAHLKDDKSENKMSFYKEAEKDSLERLQQLKNDPLYHLPSFPKDTAPLPSNGIPSSFSYDPYPIKMGSYRDANEEKVYQKLAQINKQLNNSTSTSHYQKIPTYRGNKEPEDYYSSGKDAEQLDPMMQNISAYEGNSNDSEMIHLNAMMEKILDIQHPERVRERLQEKSVKNKENVFPVTKQPVSSSTSLLSTTDIKQKAGTGFYGLTNEATVNEQNSIEAAVHQNQTLVNGAVIKLRLLNDIYVSGTLIPKGSFVFGTASLKGERLEVKISTIRYHNSLFPVRLQLYDMDGLLGIYIPGAITRDVAKSSVDHAAQMLEVTSLDPSLKAQAASAGISAIKSLLSKKAKLVKVTVKAGYKVLLQDENLKQ